MYLSYLFLVILMIMSLYVSAVSKMLMVSYVKGGTMVGKELHRQKG